MISWLEEASQFMSSTPYAALSDVATPARGSRRNG
jgi:hypothetical protein